MKIKYMNISNNWFVWKFAPTKISAYSIESWGLLEHKHVPEAHHKGGVVSEGQQSQSQSMEDVDHSSDTSMLTECYHPHSTVVMDTLIVNKTNILKPTK